MLAGNEVGDILHGPGAVERVHGYEVLERARLQFAQVALHAGGLELERAYRSSGAVQGVCLGVVERDVVDVDVDAVCLLDVGDGLFYDGQRFETKEVHFYKACLLDDGTFVLCDEHFSVLFVDSRADGYPVCDVVAAYYDAAGVHAGVAHVAFECQRVAQGVLHERVGVLKLVFKVVYVLVAVFEGGFEFLAVYFRHAFRHKSCQAVAFGERQLHHARHVFDGRFCGHGAVGYDVRHFLLSVFLRHVMEHVFSSVIVEVDVNIRQRYAVGVEKALEKQVVFQRVDLCDAEAVGHDRAGC